MVSRLNRKLAKRTAAQTGKDEERISILVPGWLGRSSRNIYTIGRYFEAEERKSWRLYHSPPLLGDRLKEPHYLYWERSVLFYSLCGSKEASLEFT